MKKPVVVILLIVILLAALGGGWWWYQSSRQQPLTLYGNVDIRTVNMSFRVGGRLASLTVDEGDSIRAGQTLGELDRAPYENALLQAQANVSTAQAQYDLMMAGYRAEEIAQAAAAVKQAQAAYDAKLLSAPARAARQQRHFRQRSGECPLLARSGAGNAQIGAG